MLSIGKKFHAPFPILNSFPVQLAIIYACEHCMNTFNGAFSLRCSSLLRSLLLMPFSVSERMGSGGFSSSPTANCFPAGLRVLVVDDDATWLRILEKMLRKCSYEVASCNLAREALHLLRQRKDGFDIVISDVNMPDMDGFKLLELVGLEMELPVIMMSGDGETSRVMKGVQHGACDYLLKPIRMKELRNIWQHVLRKRMRDFDCHDGVEENGFLFGGDYGKRKKEIESRHDDGGFSDASSFSAMKKARVVWTVDLHQKFVHALHQIGSDRAGPKKILDLMGVPWLTRENVASHLQKYRLFISRLEKQNSTGESFQSASVQHHGGLKKEESIHKSEQTTGDAAKALQSFESVGSSTVPETSLTCSTDSLPCSKVLDQTPADEGDLGSSHGLWNHDFHGYPSPSEQFYLPYTGFASSGHELLSLEDPFRFGNECPAEYPVIGHDLYIARIL